jgi:hypothetical protein
MKPDKSYIFISANLITVLLIILKLSGIIDIGWFYVFLPIMMPIFLIVFVGFGVSLLIFLSVITVILLSLIFD